MKKLQLTALMLSGIMSTASAENNFGQDVAFLKKHSDALVLSQGDAQIIVVPEWQGRVMTSTAAGDQGASYGWINYDVVKKGILPEEKREGLEKHIYIFGGEERFWLGPEGGQFGIFFKPGEKDYTFANWKTPAILDTIPFDVTASTTSKVTFEKDATLTNQSGTTFKLRFDRTVEVLAKSDFAKKVGLPVPDGVRSIAFETTNTITNTGAKAWKKDSGLLSIWMLGMYKHSPKTNVVIPLKSGTHKAVNMDYFGTLDADRLKVSDDLVFFKVDGKFRSKIGVPPQRAKNYCGSYDPTRNTLTVVQYDLPENPEKLPYVRSQWQNHAHPYAGDVINAYNDGSPEPGAKPLGPFYEIETSSPALPLQPGKSITHIQRTIHFQGDAKQLDTISKQLFGMGVDAITQAFTPQGSKK